MATPTNAAPAVRAMTVVVTGTDATREGPILLENDCQTFPAHDPTSSGDRYKSGQGFIFHLQMGRARKDSNVLFFDECGSGHDYPYQ